MSSDHIQPDTMSAFVDSELPATEITRVEAHLRECHACALQVVEAQQLKNATHRAAQRFAPPTDVLARLEAQVRGRKQAKKSVIAWPKPAWTAIAAAFLVVLSLEGWSLFQNADTLSAELLDQHLSVLSDTSAPQVLSSDRHTVKPWFQGKLPFSFNVPEPGALPPETTLVGADLTYLENKPTALLIFTIHKHRVTVLITQAEVMRNAYLPHARSGFEMAQEHAAGLEIIGMSDVNRADLEALLKVLANTQ